MKHIVTLNQANLKKSAAKGGCGEWHPASLPAKRLARLPIRSVRNKHSNQIGFKLRGRRLSLNFSCRKMQPQSGAERIIQE